MTITLVVALVVSVTVNIVVLHDFFKGDDQPKEETGNGIL